MCDEVQQERPDKTPYNQTTRQSKGIALGTESHMVYELKQKREYLLRQLFVVQQAIDAVNIANNF